MTFNGSNLSFNGSHEFFYASTPTIQSAFGVFVSGTYCCLPALVLLALFPTHLQTDGETNRHLRNRSPPSHAPQSVLMCRAL